MADSLPIQVHRSVSRVAQSMLLTVTLAMTNLNPNPLPAVGTTPLKGLRRAAIRGNTPESGVLSARSGTEVSLANQRDELGGGLEAIKSYARLDPKMLPDVPAFASIPQYKDEGQDSNFWETVGKERLNNLKLL